MDVLLFGATGMVGQGVLRACLEDPSVRRVVAVGRTPTGVPHAKLRDVVVPNVAELEAVEPELAGFDACLFCLGVSSAGMTEKMYTILTYDLTLDIARTVLRRSPGATFIYVSGQGTDSTGRGRSMWARVKGRTENALLQAGFPRAYMFRPGLIVPLDGIRSKTALYNAIYAVIRPLVPALRRLFPAQVMTTDQLGRAMVAVARDGWARPVLEAPDIIRAAR